MAGEVTRPPARSPTGVGVREQLVTQPPGQTIQSSGRAGAESPGEASEATELSTRPCGQALKSVVVGAPSRATKDAWPAMCPGHLPHTSDAPLLNHSGNSCSRAGRQSASSRRCPDSKRMMSPVAARPGSRRPGRRSTVVQLLEGVAAPVSHAAALHTAGRCATSLQWSACSRPRGAA